MPSNENQHKPTQTNTNQHKQTERNTMSYFPDYRCEENLNLLNAEDRAYLNGFRHAMGCADNFFLNLDVYEFTEDEAKVMEGARECFNDWMDMDEVEVTCAVFDSADYLPEDVDLKDVRDKSYNGGDRDGM